MKERESDSAMGRKNDGAIARWYDGTENDGMGRREDRKREVSRDRPWRVSMPVMKENFCYRQPETRDPGHEPRRYKK